MTRHAPRFVSQITVPAVNVLSGLLLRARAAGHRTAVTTQSAYAWFLDSERQPTYRPVFPYVKLDGAGPSDRAV